MRRALRVPVIIVNSYYCEKFKKHESLKNFHVITNTNLIWVDNGVDAETVPVNTLSFLIKDAFYWGVKFGKR